MQKRREVLLTFLFQNRGRGFAPAELARHTGVAMKFVARALYGAPEVAALKVGRKLYFGIS